MTQRVVADADVDAGDVARLRQAPAVQWLQPWLGGARVLFDPAVAPITRFRAAHWELSNLAELPVFGFRTPEHAYQAAKSLDPAMRAVIRALGSGGRARRAGQQNRRLILEPAEIASLASREGALLGRLGVPPLTPRLELRPDWDALRSLVMQILRVEVVRRYPHVRDLLLATGNAELVEGNTHGDTFFGRVHGVGRNELGRIHMSVRAALQAGEVPPAAG